MLLSLWQGFAHRMCRDDTSTYCLNVLDVLAGGKWPDAIEFCTSIIVALVVVQVFSNMLVLSKC